MKKCNICGTTLNRGSLNVNNILKESEKKKLEKIRTKRGVCANCSIDMLMLDIVGN